MAVLLSFGSFAQNWIDLGNVYWRNSPFNTIESNPDEKRHFNMYAADVKLPVVLNEQNVLIFGFEYMKQQVSTVPNESNLYPTLDFTSLMLQIGWEHKWNDTHKTLFMVIPRLTTDFNNVDINHFQLGGLALSTKSRSENFDWKYGLYYNSEYFGPMFVPLFGFNWKINEKWRFKTIIPLNLELSYMPNDRFRMGLRFDGVNASYKYQTIPGLPASLQYIDRADNNAWAFAEFHFGKNIWFHIKAGHSVLRKYRFFTPGDRMLLKLGPVNIGDNRNGDSPKEVPIWFQNGFSFETRLIYRLPL